MLIFALKYRTIFVVITFGLLTSVAFLWFVTNVS